MPTLNLKKVFSTCRQKFCSINGVPVGRLLDEGMLQERAMLAQAEIKSKAPFGSRNGRPDKSDGLDPQFAKLKKKLTLAQREISYLKNQLHQAKENIAKERADRGSKSKKDDSQDEEVGSKRFRQQAKQGIVERWMEAARTTRTSRRSGQAEDRAQPAEGRSRRTGGGSGPTTSIRIVAEHSLIG